MTIHECPFEGDVVDALTTDQWPDRSGAELTAHVAACAGCRDVVAVFVPLASSWAETRSEVQLPASGTVWWRAQTRARREAAAAASRPIAIAQIIGGLVAVALLAVGLIVLSPWLVSSIAASRAFLSPELGPAPVIAPGWVLGVIVAVIAATSVAVYLAVAED